MKLARLVGELRYLPSRLAGHPPARGREQPFLSVLTAGGTLVLADDTPRELISPDFLPHVFERFRQGEDATTQRHTGLGLGLGIVLQLVELHGGTVHAASPGVGQGATFTVRLPIPAGDASGQAIARVERRTMSSTTTAPAPRLQRLDGLRIPVVDDDATGARWPRWCWRRRAPACRRLPRLEKHSTCSKAVGPTPS